MNIADLQGLLSPSDSGASTDITALIEKLKAKRDMPDLKTFRKQYSPSGHDSMDKAKRPDKQIKKPNPDKPEENINITAAVNRLGLSMQKIITKRAVSFLFGSPVQITSEAETKDELLVLGALNRILKDNKINSFNRRIARDMFRATEVAECWFPVKKAEKHSSYGFDTEFKIRVMALSPWDGNELYPLFDETGDLIAFSREFKRMGDDRKEVRVFETYTDSERIVWEQAAGGWREVSRDDNVIGKIPIIFGRQDEVEWADVQTAIDRLEYLLSNFADTNDYHAAPTIFVQGKLIGFAAKGESGKIIQGDKDAKAEYLSWDNATDSVKLEIETMFRIIYSFTQTPDISFESVKGLNEISGEALKMLFMDAHLKVQDKREVFDAYLERRTNIIKAFIGTINKKLNTVAINLDIEAEVQPFVIDDVSGTIDRLISANGGKPLMSQKTSIKLAGLADDVDEEYALLQEEMERERTFDISDPTV